MAACAGMAVASIISYSSSLFIEPLEQEFNWTRTQIMSGHSIASTLAVICAPFMGLLVDRIGPRRVGIAAVIAVCCAVAMFSLANGDVNQWRALWLPLAFGIILIQPMVWTGAVTSLFSAGRGLALAVTLCGSSIASLTVPRMTEALIQAFGWRMAWVGLGAIWLAISLPLVYFYFTSARDRERIAPTKDAAVEDVIRPSIWASGILTRQFFQLLIAGVSVALVVVTLAVSVVPVLSSSGISRSDAAWIAGLVGVTSVIGRLGVGTLLDRMDGRIIAAMCVSLPIIALLILIQFPGSIPAAVVAILIIGLSLGAELDVIAYLTSRYFGRENFGFLFGTIGGFLGLATGNGPVLFSRIYDVTGSYVTGMWAAMPLCLLSAVLLLLLGPYPDRGKIA